MSPPPRPRRLRLADLRGAALLATTATANTVDLVEAVHQSVWTTLGAKPAPRTGGLTGLIYRSIRATTRGVGLGLDWLLRHGSSQLDAESSAHADDPQRAIWLAVLNGVVGDHLHATGNPLALPMSLRIDDKPWRAALPPADTAGNKLLLLIHGLCMSDLHWQGERAGRRYGHGEALAGALGYRLLHLRYNSGRHIADNGRELAAQLEHLLAQWPQPVLDLSVLAHSMGGLLIRSALDHATQVGMTWPARLRQLMFLGTPHHGAPLERVGHWIDQALSVSRFSAPFARIGQLRSAGITDLRHGNVQEHAGQPGDRFARRPDARRPLPLPAATRCLAVAATLAARHSPLADRWLGDGLVPLPSALGDHADPAHALAFAAAERAVVYRTGHLQLLSSPTVQRRLLQWLATGDDG